MSSSGNVVLKAGREKPVEQLHPWVFSGAIDERRSQIGDTPPGGIVDVRAPGGGFLARGYFNPHSAIRVRLLTWNQGEAIGPAWWRVRLARSIARRDNLVGRPDLTAYRLVNAESDGLPGLIVDRYGDYLVIQCLTMGVEVVKSAIVEALVGLLHPTGIIERSDVDIRQKEGLPAQTGVIYGDAPPSPLAIAEHGVTYLVDIQGGHKTGFYLDQRDSRAWALANPAFFAGRSVLNGFSYTGGFGICAALRGAGTVTHVDSSQAALDLAAAAADANHLPAASITYINADVFDLLRTFREEGRSFDAIILDPPKFAHSAAQIEKAARGYKDINLLAFDLLEPGGLLLTFSCSGQISPDLFQKIVFGASVDAMVQAQIIHELGQPPDHPILLSFPEGRYLKGLACRVLD